MTFSNIAIILQNTHPSPPLSTHISLFPFCSRLAPNFNCSNYQGDFRTQEEKKHRAKYRSLDDSEQKLHFFSARQIACRLLGSRGYLCQKVCHVVYFHTFYGMFGIFIFYLVSRNDKFILLFVVGLNSYGYGVEILINALQCWLPLEDCMCSSVVPSSLWRRVRFWLYMHPKV